MKAGWEFKPLGDVCDFVRGPFGGSLKKSCFVDSGFAVYEQQHAIYNQFSEIRYFVDEDKFSEMARFELRPNDLIMSCSGTMGKVAVVPADVKRGIINQALLKLTPSKELDVSFLRYWMDSPAFSEQLEETTVGVAIKNVASVKVLKTINLVLPPLEEQKRIVAVLDAAFEGLTRAKENAEANLQNARELFEASVGECFDPDQASKAGERIATLSEVARLSYGYTEKAVPEPIGPKFLRITDIQDGSVTWETVPHCRISPEKLSKYQLQRGDIVFARTGATTGKSYLIDQVENAVYASYLIRLQVKTVNLDPKYLALYFQSDKYWEDVKAGTEGAAQGGFNASKLGAMTVPVPDMERQREIIDALRKHSLHSTKLQDQYHTKLTDIADLRQSLLQKAFAGELT